MAERKGRARRVSLPPPFLPLLVSFAQSGLEKFLLYVLHGSSGILHRGRVLALKVYLYVVLVGEKLDRSFTKPRSLSSSRRSQPSSPKWLLGLEATGEREMVS